MGGIDTDPCSNERSIVGAATEYTVHDNGLAQRWYGRVYVNPPYGRQIVWWMLKALLEMRAGRASEVIFLVPARVDTQWWAACAMQARSICIPRGRRVFVGADASAPFPVAFIYFGNSQGKRRFESVFGGEGSFWRPTFAQRLAARDRELMLLGMTDTTDANAEQAPSSPFASLAQGLASQFLHSIYEEIKHLTVEEAVNMLAGPFLAGYAQGELAAALEHENTIANAGERAIESANKKAAEKKNGKKADKAVGRATKKKTTKKKAKSKKAPKKVAKSSAKKTKKVAPPKPQTAKGAGQTKATQQLDAAVLDEVSKLSKKIGEVKLGDLMERLPDHSDQQIRRSLARNVKAGAIVREGATKNTVYRVA